MIVRASRRYYKLRLSLSFDPLPFNQHEVEMRTKDCQRTQTVAPKAC